MLIIKQEVLGVIIASFEALADFSIPPPTLGKFCQNFFRFHDRARLLPPWKILSFFLGQVPSLTETPF